MHLHNWTPWAERCHVRAWVTVDREDTRTIHRGPVVTRSRSCTRADCAATRSQLVHRRSWHSEVTNPPPAVADVE